MKKHRKTILILSLMAVIVSGYIFMSYGIGKEEGLVAALKKYLPVEAKLYLRETLFFYKNQKILKEELLEKEKQNMQLHNTNKELRKEYENTLAEKDRIISIQEREIKESNQLLVRLSANQKSIDFKRYKAPLNIDLHDRQYRLQRYKTHTLLYGKHAGAVGSSYLELADGKLYLATATGVFGYVDITEINKDRFSLKTIDTNIQDLVTYDEFYETSRYGIKDLLIFRSKLYVSYSNQVKPDCFNTSILVADLNTAQLEFQKFFVPHICVNKNNEYGYFNPHSSGGRMVPYKNDEILFTVGEYQYRDHAQDDRNELGKILAINIETKEYKIISKGHRNPQGLYYVAADNVILSTEHGPQGGDEINVNVSPGERIENYGWPVSSYGEHYGFKTRNDSKLIYKKAPLYKSHIDHGFMEPLRYFTPSIAISEIIKLPEKFNGIKEKQIFVGSMGTNIEEGDMSIHQLLLSEDYSVLSHDSAPVNERIRDMIYHEQTNKIYLYLESTPSIGVLTPVH